MTEFDKYGQPFKQDEQVRRRLILKIAFGSLSTVAIAAGTKVAGPELLRRVSRDDEHTDERLARVEQELTVTRELLEEVLWGVANIATNASNTAENFSEELKEVKQDSEGSVQTFQQMIADSNRMENHIDRFVGKMDGKTLAASLRSAQGEFVSVDSAINSIAPISGKAIKEEIKTIPLVGEAVVEKMEIGLREGERKLVNGIASAGYIGDTLAEVRSKIFPPLINRGRRLIQAEGESINAADKSTKSLGDFGKQLQTLFDEALMKKQKIDQGSPDKPLLPKK